MSDEPKAAPEWACVLCAILVLCVVSFGAIGVLALQSKAAYDARVEARR